MKNRLGYRLMAVVIVICMLCSGCNIIGSDVENQLIPPQNDVEQNAMQAALNEQLQTQNFVLTYPMSGTYRTPFVVLNQIQKATIIRPASDDVKEPETAVLDGWGLVFYRYTVGNAKTRIHLLRKDEKKVWNTVADVEGAGVEIGDVNFADLTGDGFPELLLGWTLYGTNEKRLSVYRLNQQLEAILCDLTYEELMVGDLTGDGAEDIVIVSTGNNNQRVKAQLYSLQDNRISLRGDTVLDRNIQQVEKVTLAALSPSVIGLYLDCKKNADTMITELLYWNGTTFESPLSDDATAVNTVTTRNGDLYACDIDGDGDLEWPTSRVGGITDWVSYDFRAGALSTKFHSVVNAEDGYLIRLHADWLDTEKITIGYSTEEAVLYLENNETERRFLEILTIPNAKKAELPEGYRVISERNDKKYAVRIDSETITLEEVQYLFVVM